MFRSLLSRVPSSAVLEVEDDTIALNVEAMYALLPAAPQWRSFTGACESMLGAVHASVAAEVESTVRVLASLECRELGSADAKACVSGAWPQKDDDSSSESSSSASDEDEPLFRIDLLPTIIVTPCEDAPPPCWVPLQDADFGHRLVVPAQPTVNGAFPPLALPKTAAPPTKRWEYTDGHWRAVVPTMEEQAKRGWAARSMALNARRRRQAR